MKYDDDYSEKLALKQRLLDDVDAEYICEMVGVEMRHRGHATEVLCPFHNDTHYGSARIRGKGIYCFVCAKQYSIFDVVMKKLELPYYEAYKYVAEATGDLTTYMMPKSRVKVKKEDQFPLNKDELKMLGLSDQRIKLIKGWQYDKPDEKTRYYSELDPNSTEDDLRWYYVLYDYAHWSIRDLWKEDRPEAVQIMGDKACDLADYLHGLNEEAGDNPYGELLDQLVSIYRKLRRQGYRKTVEVHPELKITKPDNNNVFF